MATNTDLLDFVSGDETGFSMPARPDALREGGAQFLTEAFREANPRFVLASEINFTKRVYFKMLCNRILSIFIFLLISSLSVMANGEKVSSHTVVVTLGTQGGPQPNPYRSQPANAVIVNGTVYLVDAGNGVARQLTLAGVPITSIKTIFITHNHDDHNADLGTLMGLSWSLHSRNDFDVYGPAGTQQVVNGFLQSYAINAAIRKEDSPWWLRWGSIEGKIHVHDIGNAPSAKVIYKDDNVQVSAIENCHYHFSQPLETKYGEEKSYALRFQTKDRVVVFSGDTGPCGGRLASFAKHADILVDEVFSPPLMAENIRSNGLMAHVPSPLITALLKRAEKYHSTPEVVGKRAEAAGVGMVVLTHVMPGRQADPDEAYTAGVSKYYAGKVVVARDLGRY